MKKPRRPAATVILLNMVIWIGAADSLTHGVVWPRLCLTARTRRRTRRGTAEAVRAMTVPAGFQVEVVAASPTSSIRWR